MKLTDFGRETRESDDFWMRESCPIITIDFPLGAQNCERIPKTRVSRFCLFTPLLRRFRLSRVSKSIDLDDTYRLVSKMFNFMPCGSVLSKSSANCRQIELGSAFLELTTTFGRFADDLRTTFAARANRRQIELGWVFLELTTTFGRFAKDSGSI